MRSHKYFHVAPIAPVTRHHWNWALVTFQTQLPVHDFAAKFLRTDPAEVAVRVADSILKPRARIVLGFGARKTQLGANFLPRKVFTRALWQQISPTIDQSAYPSPIAK